MPKYALNGWRKQYGLRIIEADSLEDAEEKAWSFSEDDFEWDNDGMDIEVEEFE